MPIGTPIARPIDTTTAPERARAEADRWVELARHWTESGPTETAVVVFYDPKTDLERRASDWGHTFDAVDLSALALFAAGLAITEAEAWEEETLDVATRAYEARRFLLGDRIIHWAVPWLEAMQARSDCGFLLDLADEMQLAPQLPGREGLQAHGEDSYGPIGVGVGDTRSLWSGAVILKSPDDPVHLYRQASARWDELAQARPGSSQLWADLSERAAASADACG
jgi:hypothetical protein